jgi:tRNA threonylcarbamoyladenosine biosynthesis protein TsaE
MEQASADGSLHYRSGSPEQTRALARALGRVLDDGRVIALTGDLGAGKTAFVQGLARGLDVPESYYITSPTYTLVNEYPGRVPLFHVDLYRLAPPVDLEEIGLGDVLHLAGVVAVEWAERIDPHQLAAHLKVAISIDPDETRRIDISPSGLEAGNLLKALKKSAKEPI